MILLVWADTTCLIILSWPAWDVQSMFKSDSTLKAVGDYCLMNAENPPSRTALRSDLCLSLYSVGVQSILIEQLTVVLQVSPKLNCILPQLKQKNNLSNSQGRACLSHQIKLLLLHMIFKITWKCAMVIKGNGLLRISANSPVAATVPGCQIVHRRLLNMSRHTSQH